MFIGKKVLLVLYWSFCLIFANTGALFSQNYKNSFENIDSLQGWDDNLHSCWDMPGVWKIKNGKLVSQAEKVKRNSGIYYVKEKFYNFTLVVDVIFYTKSTVVIPFRYQNMNTWYGLYLHPSKDNHNIWFYAWLYKKQPRFTGIISKKIGFQFSPQIPYTVKLKVKDTHFYAKVWEKGKPEPGKWMVTTENNFITQPGFIGLSVQRAGDSFHAEFDNLIIKGEK